MFRRGLDTGGKDQEVRMTAIEEFKSGKKDILVATDVASKGLDFPEIRHVINFDMPVDIENYVHIIGRTGRCVMTGLVLEGISSAWHSWVPHLEMFRHGLHSRRQRPRGKDIENWIGRCGKTWLATTFVAIDFRKVIGAVSALMDLKHLLLHETIQGSESLLVMSSRTWLSYAYQNRLNLVPLFYETLEHASGFASEQCSEGIVAISTNTLRILALEKLGTVGVQVGRMGCFPAYGRNSNSRNVSCSQPSLHRQGASRVGALYKW